MVEAGWRPTVDNYLGRVTKPRILEAVREAIRNAPAADSRLTAILEAQRAGQLRSRARWYGFPVPTIQHLADGPLRRVSATVRNPAELTTHLIPPLLGLTERGGSRVNGRAVPASSEIRCVTRET
jgi:hypothetical protein